ncbi:WD repeat-containing protein 92 [Mucor ambiguus]|uniref:WD repeat-containing protein 92 n=1 Tax=Mucor ambiguus TaxID=91626 RepID=A0A0C9LR41_9FUNG|nr:WD repeat-containing protein 92 [Mucor ambiguus]
MSTSSISLLTRELSFAPYDVKWIPCSSRVCTVGATNHGTGKIAVYNLVGKQLELKTETETNAAVRCATIAGQTRSLATGDFEGQLQIWDTQRFDIPLISFKAHESIINSIDSYNQSKEPQEIVTGSRDGTVKVWDARQQEKAVLTIKSKESIDIWAVAYGQLKGEKVIAVGYENGDIKLFHVNGSQYLWELHVKDGICSIEFNHDKLLASTLSGAHVIDIATGKTSEIQSPTTVWSIRHIPQQSQYFSVAGGDGNLTTYNQQDMKPTNVLALSKHPIISLDWNKDKKGLLACCSFDQSLKIGMVFNGQ